MIDLYCDYCEREGHTFRSCPARDDDDGLEPVTWRDDEPIWEDE